MNDLLLTRVALDRLHDLQRRGEERALLRMALGATAPVRTPASSPAPTPAPTPAAPRGTVPGSRRAAGFGRFLLGSRADRQDIRQDIRQNIRQGVRSGTRPDAVATAITSADVCSTSPSSGVCCGTAA